MLLHKPSPRRFAALILGVFVVGAGIGAGVVLALGSGRSNTRHAMGTTASGAARATRRSPAAPPTRAPGRALTPSGPRAAVPLVDPGADASFDRLEQRVNGHVGLAAAPLAGGPIATFGVTQIAHAWSTSKVPVLVTLLRDYEDRHQAVGAQDRANAAAALEESDNAAIEALFAELEQIHGGLVPASSAVQETLRRAGDAATTINTAPNDEGFTTYGQTEWSLSGEVTFYRALAQGCLLDGAGTDYVLGLMRNVTSSQRWGAGSAGYGPGVPLAFKGGWGPVNGRYQVRQTAIVGTGPHGYVISLLALPASGSFDDGTALLTSLGTWAKQHLSLDASGTDRTCSAQH